MDDPPDDIDAEEEHYKREMQIRCHPYGAEKWQFDLFLLERYANDDLVENETDTEEIRWRDRLEQEFPAIPDPG